MNADFNVQKCIESISDQFRQWANQVGAKRFVVGISGGKDSTIVAALSARIFGKENVYGVMMPNGGQCDIEDSFHVFNALGINKRFVNIKCAYDDIVSRVQSCGSQCEPLTEQAKINIAPRIRMLVLYAIAQNIDGFVLNTDNLDERILGYSTLWGDSVGSYAPIQNLTVSEVIAIGEELGLPVGLTHKLPSDGLTGVSDEEKIGIKYSDLDTLIRTGIGTSELKETVFERYNKNKFKMSMIHLSGPVFDYKNYLLG